MHSKCRKCRFRDPKFQNGISNLYILLKSALKMQEMPFQRPKFQKSTSWMILWLLNLYFLDTSAPIQIKEINLKSSYPIQIKPNAKISASGSYYNGYLQATSQSTFKAHVVIKKKIGSGWFSTFIKIPCINKMGSW